MQKCPQKKLDATADTAATATAKALVEKLMKLVQRDTDAIIQQGIDEMKNWISLKGRPKIGHVYALWDDIDWTRGQQIEDVKNWFKIRCAKKIASHIS